MHVSDKLCCKVFAPAPDSGDVGKENICEIRGFKILAQKHFQGDKSCDGICKKLKL